MNVIDSREDILFNLRYAICYGTRLERLVSRWVLFSRCVALVVATSAVASISPAFPSWFLVAGGVALAVLTIFNIVVDPGKQALICRDQVRETADILSRASTMSDDELRSADARLMRTGLPELKSLRIPVFNEVVEQLGRSDAVRGSTRLGRFVYLFS